MPRTQGSGLTEDQARALAKVLKEHLPRFDSNQSSMARAWGLSQPQLSQMIMAKGRGAGISVLCRIRAMTGLSIDELLGLDKSAPIGPSLQDRVRAELAEAIGEISVETTPDKKTGRLRLVPKPSDRG